MDVRSWSRGVAACAALFGAAVGAQDGPLPAEPTQVAVTAPDQAPGIVVLEAVTVVGQPQEAREVNGSVGVLEKDVLDSSRVFTTNEALRKVPGLTVRDEEGFGMRPNIGVRGLNPTRSTKVLLLEDGVPLGYAPYGDNASYYHPPVDRFDRIEVLKGAEMNLYGPQTIGAAINYVTPIPPQALGGAVRLAGGGRDFFEARGQLGGKGVLADVLHKEGDGARDNTHSQVEDLNLKALVDLAPGHRLILRGNRFREDSEVTYSGLTDAEYANFGGEYNPFDNDTFNARRYGGSVTHEWGFGENRTLTTHVYVTHFSRDWWRQASTTTDTQCNATTYPDGAGGTLTFQQAREAGLRVNPDDCASAQGRLRDYYTYGIEPRLSVGHALFGLDNHLQAGLRFLRDTQDRLQLNATTPRGRDGVRSESNKRETDGMAAYVQNRFASGPWSITPGVRVESVDYLRRNRLTGDQGENDLTEVLPSLGASWAFSPRYLAYASVHKGFAPPRTEDVIGSTGGSVDVDAEESLNAEIGLRATPVNGLHFEATAFRNDFENLVAVGSIAGGVPLSQGEVLFQGYELSGRADLGGFVGTSGSNPFVELAYTALPKARTEEAFIRLDDGTAIPGSEKGRRLPYAPKHTVTGTIGYAHRTVFDVRFETVFVDRQYSDFANTEDAPANGTGQVGEIADYTIYNLSANLRPPGSAWSFFATAKNLTDKEYIVDRTRGILSGMPRLVYGGVEYVF